MLPINISHGSPREKGGHPRRSTYASESQCVNTMRCRADLHSGGKNRSAFLKQSNCLSRLTPPPIPSPHDKGRKKKKTKTKHWPLNFKSNNLVTSAEHLVALRKHELCESKSWHQNENDTAAKCCQLQTQNGATGVHMQQKVSTLVTIPGTQEKSFKIFK